MILFSRFAYGIQMAGLVLKMVYYWQFHIWRDLFVPLAFKSKKRSHRRLEEDGPDGEESVSEKSL